MSNTDNIQRALKDVAIIREVLNGKEQDDNVDTKLSGVTLSANVILQGGAFAFAALLLIYELVSGSLLSTIMMLEGQFEELRHYAIGFMGFSLIGLLIPLYFVLWRAAKHNGESMNTYIMRNFRYLRNMALLSDLLMKFITLSLAMLAGKPEWVAPLLTVFIGDYLLQNRFFTLPTKLSIVLGVACIALGIALFINNAYFLYVPLLVFTLVSATSLVRLLYRYGAVNRSSKQSIDAS